MKLSKPRIFDGILHHDDPKISRPIRAADWFLDDLRAADRLWMVTAKGIRSDLSRKAHADPDDLQQQLNQVSKNLESWCAERRIYDDSVDGPFCDDFVFFRNPAAYELYVLWFKYWEDLAVAHALEFLPPCRPLRTNDR